MDDHIRFDDESKPLVDDKNYDNCNTTNTCKVDEKTYTLHHEKTNNIKLRVKKVQWLKMALNQSRSI